MARQRAPGQIVRLKDDSKAAAKARQKLLRESRKEDRRRAKKGCKFWSW